MNFYISLILYIYIYLNGYGVPSYTYTCYCLIIISLRSKTIKNTFINLKFKPYEVGAYLYDTNLIYAHP